MGKFSRDKGARNERELVNLLKDLGLDAKRVPLSGAADGFKGDVVIPSLDWSIECKVRANGFKKIYEWLGNHDALAIKRDRSEWLLVLRLPTLREAIAFSCSACRRRKEKDE